MASYDYHSSAKKNKVGRLDTLCWYCANYSGGCEWSQEFKPVEGWDASPREATASMPESYMIYDCPKFENDC